MNTMLNMKQDSLSVFFFLIAFTISAQSGRIVRGPYLNSVSSSSATIRWRTDEAASSGVSYGTSPDALYKKKRDKTRSLDHEIRVDGLSSGTKYYYSFGSSRKLTHKSESQYFQTAPEKGSSASVRIWALGDFGNGSKNQTDIRDAILKITEDHRPDAWIWLGDNAYDYGRDEEYQQQVFDVYEEGFLKNTAVYPSPGNHEYRDQVRGQTIPYFNIFTLPTHGETGGIASGSESYYSVDYGNVHLVSLNSYEVLNDADYIFDTTSRQVEWLKKDLAANQLPWTIVYFHYPPFTKSGSHDMDTEEALVKIRQNLVPVLERYRVDLVLSGHSHVYERTYPILGHYGLADSFDPQTHVFSVGADSHYQVKEARQGIIYIVAGSGGQLDDQEKGVPLKSAVYYNNTIAGSILLDISGNKLVGRWVCADGIVRDEFSIEK